MRLKVQLPQCVRAWRSAVLLLLCLVECTSVRLRISTVSSLQAFSLAPLFVWFELLFLLGYRPQLYAQLQERVSANLRQLKAAQKVGKE